MSEVKIFPLLKEYFWYCPEQDEAFVFYMDLADCVMNKHTAPKTIAKIVVQSKDFKKGYLVHRGGATLHYIGEI